MTGFGLRESAGLSAFIGTKFKMVGCISVALNKIEKHGKIVLCCVISRLAQNVLSLKRLFYKIKPLELRNKLNRFNKDGLNDDFQVSMLSKVRLQLVYLPPKITYICAF